MSANPVQLGLAQRSHAPAVVDHYACDAHSREHRGVVALVRSRGTARQPAEPGTHRALARQGVDAAVQFARVVPEDFASGLDGRYLVVLDGTGAARYRSSPVPEELVQLVRAPRAECRRRAGRHDDPRLVRGGPRMARRHDLPAAESCPAIRTRADTIVVFAPEATFGIDGVGAGADGAWRCWRSPSSLPSRSPPSSASVTCRHCAPCSAGSRDLRERRFETLPRSTVEEFTRARARVQCHPHVPAARLARVRSAGRSRSRVARRQRDRSRARHRAAEIPRIDTRVSAWA